MNLPKHIANVLDDTFIAYRNIDANILTINSIDSSDTDATQFAQFSFFFLNGNCGFETT